MRVSPSKNVRSKDVCTVMSEKKSEYYSFCSINYLLNMSQNRSKLHIFVTCIYLSELTDKKFNIEGYI